MSGIAGIYNLNGRPADRTLLERMTDIIAHRGTDGVGLWIDGPVGLGHRMLHTTPESLQEQQPLVDETGTLCLTFDGRIDNRAELRVVLQAKGIKVRSESDAELVLGAYECWGEECPKKLIGDFAFAIWDGRNQQLFCARDPLGMKPFYYHSDDRTFLWASEPRQLFEAPTVPREPNEGMIGEYLANAITNKEETLYRSVFRLPPAHFLVLQANRLRKQRYWDIDPAKEIQYRTDEEYVDHFLEIFTDAVRCRLHSHRPVGVELSGGLDSSSIVGIAQSLYQGGWGAAHSGETFSLVFPELPCDESTYIQEVVQMWGVKSHTMCPGQWEAAYYAEQVRRYHDFPDYPNGSMSDPLKALAREKGFRVLLTGVGGDEWLTGSFYHYADLLRRLRILTLIRQVRFDSRVPGIIFPSFPVLKAGLWPLLPAPIRSVIKRLIQRERIPQWMDAHFARRIRLSERLQQKDVGRRFSSCAQEYLYTTSTCGWGVHSTEIEERSTAWFGLEQRHPFHDRRLVEFALALPEEQRWRQAQPKFLLRQAMRGLLPETIRQRCTKAEFSVVLAKALQPQEGEGLFDSLSIASLGWVNEERVRTMYRHMVQLSARGDKRYMSYVWPLWMIFGIELWFRTVFLYRGVVSSGGLCVQKDNF